MLHANCLAPGVGIEPTLFYTVCRLTVGNITTLPSRNYSCDLRVRPCACLVAPAGDDPTTSRLSGECSTNHELRSYHSAPQAGVEPACVQLTFQLVRSQRVYWGSIFVQGVGLLGLEMGYPAGLLS